MVSIAVATDHFSICVNGVESGRILLSNWQELSSNGVQIGTIAEVELDESSSISQQVVWELEVLLSTPFESSDLIFKFLQEPFFYLTFLTFLCLVTNAGFSLNRDCGRRSIEAGLLCRQSGNMARKRWYFCLWPSKNVRHK